jgi:hypothetical protein
MKKILLFLIACILISCGAMKNSATLNVEDQLYNTRKYIGNFIDYCHTGPEISGGAHLIWIKTSLYNSFGKISAFGKTCDFSVGERIYLRRLTSIPNATGNWSFQIENDSSVYYMVSGYRYENNSIVLASF